MFLSHMGSCERCWLPQRNTPKHMCGLHPDRPKLLWRSIWLACFRRRASYAPWFVSSEKAMLRATALLCALPLYIYNYIYIMNANTGSFSVSHDAMGLLGLPECLMSQYVFKSCTKLKFQNLYWPAQGMWLISRTLWRKWTPSTIFVTTPWPMENFTISKLSH